MNLKKLIMKNMKILLICSVMVTTPTLHINESAPILSSTVYKKVLVKPVNRGKIKRFMKDIAKSESNNDYGAVSKRGHLGRYQFSPKTIKFLGNEVNDSVFLSSPKTQDQIMVQYMKYNRKILIKYIEEWDGKLFGNEIITESGILAAAHLVGPGGVKKFFNGDRKVKDGNGVYLSEYLTKYSGYDLQLN
jgi:hypothetical protein